MIKLIPIANAKSMTICTLFKNPEAFSLEIKFLTEISRSYVIISQTNLFPNSNHNH
ncbi:MAG: hypothetical protein MAG581_02042 [Deltaproteobacteria bacterium]|nr:hypothetical protein [Deltaproteobacteria bacterium]